MGLLLRSVLRPEVPIGFQRWWMETVARGIPLPPGIRTAKNTLGGVPTLRVRPKDSNPSRAVLYLHGGGYVVGSARTYLGLGAHLALAADATVYLIDYRLAPEHPFPAMRDDAVAAYRALLASAWEPHQIAVAGDSAGGGLALSTAVRLRDTGEPLPAALALISPWLDVARWSDSRMLHPDDDPLLRVAWVEMLAEQCRGTVEPDDPGLSPAYADLTGLPPILVQAGQDDLLAPDSALLYSLAQKAGVPIDYVPYEGLWHEFQTLAGSLAEADAAVSDMGRFIHEHT
jgi:acetyl esterase/lipase